LTIGDEMNSVSYAVKLNQRVGNKVIDYD